MLFKVTFLTKENGFWNFNRILEFSKSKFMTQICVCIYIYIYILGMLIFRNLIILTENVAI